MYQRSDRPSGGNFNDCDAVNDVSSMTSVGPTRKRIATAASAPNTRRSDNASQSTECSGAAIGLALAADHGEQRHRGEHREHEDHGDRRRKWPVVGADRLLIDVQRLSETQRMPDASRR